MLLGAVFHGFSAARTPTAAWRARIERNLARYGSGHRGHGVVLREVVVDRFKGRDDVTATFGAPTGLSQHNLLMHLEDYELRDLAARALGVPYAEVDLDDVQRGAATRTNDSVVWTATTANRSAIR